MKPLDFLLLNPGLFVVGVLISACITYLSYAYNEYKWPFHWLSRTDGGYLLDLWE